ncbi:MAG: class I SAM-dependent methyltransferase [Leptolyngbyaceae cyanobacterium]|mgnify:FL=1
MQIYTAVHQDEIGVSLRRPTWKRFRNLFWSKHDLSILRVLEYEILDECQMAGKILDIGGGEKVSYFRDCLSRWTVAEEKSIYESVNIDIKVSPTYLVEPGAPIPVIDESYDVVFALNTFEHIYNLSELISEIHRVLRPGGKLLFTVPFIFRVHGCPDDYFRGTPSFWQALLSKHKFLKIETEAINWGPFSTGLFISGVPGPFKRLRKNLALILDIYYHRSRYGDADYHSWHQGHQLCNAPLGYFVTARKGGKDVT